MERVVERLMKPRNKELLKKFLEKVIFQETICPDSVDSSLPIIECDFDEGDCAKCWLNATKMKRRK